MIELICYKDVYYKG